MSLHPRLRASQPPRGHSFSRSQRRRENHEAKSHARQKSVQSHSRPAVPAAHSTRTTNTAPVAAAKIPSEASRPPALCPIDLHHSSRLACLRHLRPYCDCEGVSVPARSAFVPTHAIRQLITSPRPPPESPQKILSDPPGALHHADTHTRNLAPSDACTNRTKSPSA